jgi:hypothetical protein
MTRIALALCLALLPLALTTAARADDTTNGQWAVDRVAESSSRVQLDLRSESKAHDNSHWESEHDAELSQVGLSAADLDSGGKHVQFTIARDAGSFVCDGWAGHGHANGTFTFTPNAAFADGLRRRGFTAVPAEKVLASASLDLTLAYIDAVSASGYPRMAYDRYITFRALGITPDSIAGLRKTFGGILEAEQVVSLTALHVTPAYVDELRSLGIGPLSAQKAVELKALGIDRSYVERLAKVGYAHLGAGELVQMKALGIDEAYIQHLADHGMRNLTVSQLVRMKAVGI